MIYGGSFKRRNPVLNHGGEEARRGEGDEKALRWGGLVRKNDKSV
jgi:hypothetical protein